MTGVACAIVDANDLHKAKVLGASRGVDRAAVEQALLDNPHGNGDEQTPIVVLKWRAAGENPLQCLPRSRCFCGIGFVFSLIRFRSLLPLLRSIQLAQHAYEDAPASHQTKTGTPTMGGIVFIVPMLFFFGLPRSRLPAMIFLVLACGAIGFIDDILGSRADATKVCARAPSCLRPRSSRSSSCA